MIGWCLPAPESTGCWLSGCVVLLLTGTRSWRPRPRGCGVGFPIRKLPACALSHDSTSGPSAPAESSEVTLGAVHGASSLQEVMTHSEHKVPKMPSDHRPNKGGGFDLWLLVGCGGWFWI